VVEDVFEYSVFTCIASIYGPFRAEVDVLEPTRILMLQDKAVRAMDYLWHSRHRSSDLVGMVINIHNGDWVRRGTYCLSY
jgi:hypothetical protein